MKICIISSRYPTDVDKTALTFVQQLAWSMADEGVEVSVICPLPVNINRKYKTIPDRICESTYLNNKVEVFFPKFWGFGQRTISCFNTALLTTVTFIRTVRSTVKKYGLTPNVFYGHFITPAGLAACTLANEMKVKSFIAYGESTTWSIDHYGRARVKKALVDVAGIIAVSTKNKNEIVSTGVVDANKVKVFPNGYIPDRFFKTDKIEARKKFNIPENKFVVGFVGHFIKRKGFDVLNEVIDSAEDVYMICAGKGDITVTSNKVLFANPVAPEELKYFYNAADIFVLPTLNEGCCNAIIEAMACGLPIISSDKDFNYDVLDGSNSILVDPLNKDAIRKAIIELKNDTERREHMSMESLRKAENMTLQKRTKNILDYIGTIEE